MVQAMKKKVLTATLVLVTGTVLFHTSSYMNFQGHQVEHSSSSSSSSSSSPSHHQIQGDDPPVLLHHVQLLHPTSEPQVEVSSNPRIQTPSEDHQLQLEQDAYSQVGIIAGSTIKPEDVPKPVTYLDPSGRYLGFLTYAGLTNQFIALENAAYLALRLNRTLILPPMTTNSHDNFNSNQRWSEVLNLTRFTEQTGVPVLEWSHVRPLTHEQEAIGREQARLGFHPFAPWNLLAEDLKCQVIYGFGDSESIHTTERTFLHQFLFRPKFVRPPERDPKTAVYDRLKIGAKDNLFLEDVVTMDDLVDRYRTFSESMLLLSHTFKLKDPLGRRSWDAVGQHFHFTEKIDEYATRLVRNRAPESRDDGKFIAVHIRRGDIWQKCRHLQHSEGDPSLECTVPLGRYAEAVEKAQQWAAKNSGQESQQGGPKQHKRLPVLVTTDSTSKRDHDILARLGWRRLNHDRYTTEEEIGIFGPVVIDAWILANAEVMVGTKVSTMTRVASRRQWSWQGHDVLYPRTSPSWAPPV